MVCLGPFRIEWLGVVGCGRTLSVTAALFLGHFCPLDKPKRFGNNSLTMTNTTHAFDAIANEVAPILMKQSDVFVEWTFEYPGYIALRTDGGGVWNIGTANGTWGGDLFIAEESHLNGEPPDHSIDTGISADCQDAAQIAEALYRAMTEVR